MGNMAQGQSISGPLKISQIISYLYTFRKKTHAHQPLASSLPEW